MARPFILLSNPSRWPEYFNEPESVYDLRLDYPPIDIEPLPGIPKVGQVVRSSAYTAWYHSLTDEIEKEKARRPKLIKKKSQFLSEIQRGAGIAQGEHLSVKNAFYLAGNVPLVVAPDVGEVFITPRTHLQVNPPNISFSIGDAFFYTFIPGSGSISYFSPLYYMSVKTNTGYRLFLQNCNFLYSPFSLDYNFFRDELVYIEFTNGKRAFVERVFEIEAAYGGTFFVAFMREIASGDIILFMGDGGSYGTIFVSVLDNTPLNDWVQVKQRIIDKADYELDKIVTASYEITSNLMSITRTYPAPPDARTTWPSSLEVRFIALGLHDRVQNLDGYLIFNELDQAWQNAIGGALDWVNLDPTLQLYSTLLSFSTSHPPAQLQFDTSITSLTSDFNIPDLSTITAQTTTFNGYSNFDDNVLHLNNYNVQDPLFIFYPYFQSNNLALLQQAINDYFNNNPPKDLGIYAKDTRTTRSDLISLPTQIIQYTLNSFQSALEEIDNVDLLLDGGFTSTRSDFSLYADKIATQALNSEGEKIIALAVINTPFNTNPSFSYSLPTPTLNNTFITANYFVYEGLGYRVLLPASSLYALLVGQMSGNLNEFAPVYNRGIIPISPIDKVYTRQQREELARKRINSLRPYNGAWVFNNNMTADLNNTIFKEENIRRLANAIARECKLVLKSFIGQKNVKETRDRVIVKVRDMLRKVIDIHKYKPTEYLIICDESNNRDYSRYLYVDISVRMPMSIKYVRLVQVAQLIEP